MEPSYLFVPVLNIIQPVNYIVSRHTITMILKNTSKHLTMYFFVFQDISLHKYFTIISVCFGECSKWFSYLPTRL